jgi:hypothetical protein
MIDVSVAILGLASVAVFAAHAFDAYRSGASAGDSNKEWPRRETCAQATNLEYSHLCQTR